MSYIRTANTYAYQNSDGDLMVHSNAVTDQKAAEIGSGRKYEFSYRYFVRIPADEFRMMVRRILEECRPPWVTDTMIDEWMAKRDEDFRSI